MLRLDPEDIHGSLLRSTRILSESSGNKDMNLIGSPSANARLSKQVDLAWAAKVVAVIDRDMEELPRNWYQFVYSIGDMHVAYMRLFQYVRSEFRVEDDHRADVADNMLGLMTLAPWEMRHRVLNRGGTLHSHARLAELLGIHHRNFKRTYRESWYQMIVLLIEIGYLHEHILKDRISSLVDLGAHVGKIA